MFKLKKMICKRCGKQRLKTKKGICLICEPNIIHGNEIKVNKNGSNKGIEVKSKTGKIDENKYFR